MPDIFTKRMRSKVMARIQGRGNKETELAFARLLRSHQVSGWRRQYRITIAEAVSAGGQMQRSFKVRPDFVFKAGKVAVFVDGCFWHACPYHATRPKSNVDFWRQKLEANRRRDRLVNRKLRESNWTVLRIWEHQLKRGDEILIQLKRRLEIAGTNRRRSG